ncbi:hypothetical protein BGZ95_004723, partial [Linnemannia exigua]
MVIVYDEGFDSEDSDEDGDERVIPLSGGGIPPLAKPSRNRDGKQRVNAVRNVKPGTVAGTKIGDVQKEVIGVVNATIRKFSAPNENKLWKLQTIKHMYKYIKDQYDKCAKLVDKTGGGDTESLTMEDAIADITLYYPGLLLIFGAQLTRNHPPSRDASVHGQALFTLDEPDLEKQVPGAVSFAFSRSKANLNNKDHLFEASVINIMSEFTDAIKNNKASTANGSVGDIVERERAAFDLERQALDRMRQTLENEKAALDKDREGLSNEKAAWEKKW